MKAVSKAHGRTWFIDLDGTVFEHNRYKDHPGELERLLPHALVFLRRIPDHDTIVFTTGRVGRDLRTTVASLRKARIRYDRIVGGLPNGVRILINDEKLHHIRRTAFAVTVSRNGRKGSVHRKLSAGLYKQIESGRC